MPDPDPPNLPRPRVFSNCGGLFPTSYQYGGTNIPDPSLPLIPYCPNGNCGNPRPFRPQDDPFVCVCAGALSPGRQGCEEESTRFCIRLSQVGTAPRSVETYATEEECRTNAFDKYPCWLSVIRCVETIEQCEEPSRASGFVLLTETKTIRSCIEQAPQINRPAGTYKSFAQCAPRCVSTDCLLRKDPTIPDPVFRWKCETFPQTCPIEPGEEFPLTYMQKRCVPCTQQEIATNPNACRYLTANCDGECNQISCGYKCTFDFERCPDQVNQRRTGYCTKCTTEDPNCTPGLTGQLCRQTCTDITCPPITPSVIITEPLAVVTENPRTNEGGGVGSTGIPTGISTTIPGVITVNSAGTQPIDVRVRTIPRKITEARYGYNRDGDSCVECLNPSPCQFRTLETCLQSVRSNSTNPVEIPPRSTIFNQKPTYITQANYEEYSQSPQGTVAFRDAPSPELGTNPRWNDVKVIGGKTRFVKTIDFNNSKNILYVDDRDQSKVNINYKQVYDNVYNFFQKTPNPKTKLVENDLRLDIFNKTVAEEVRYFLLKNETGYSVNWKESYYFDLTLDKLAISLNKEFLNSIQSIHGVDNNLIQPDLFLTALLQMLRSGRLDEFDPGFYSEIASFQNSDELLEIIAPNDSTISERAALTLVINGAAPTDEGYYQEIDKLKIIRQKRLNTDIGVNIAATTIDASTISIPLEDAGISITTIDATDTYADIGVGDNYFIEVADILGNELDVPLDSKNSVATFTPDSVRVAALKTLNQDPYSLLVVSSTSSNNEFLTSYTMRETEPMYFYLDLSSIKILNEDESLVNNLQATYKRLTNEEKINNHLINYGFNVTKLNLDFRDPFVSYAYDTSSFTLNQNDITFRNFDFYLEGNHINDFILTRNLPFAIILVPGCGSRHNPFDIMSDINGYKDEIVERSIYCTQTIKINDVKKLDTAVDEVALSQTSNPNEDFYGYTDKLFYQYNPTSYGRTYYYKNEYLESAPSEISGRRSIMSKIVREVLDPVVQVYQPDELKWFDVFSRLNYNEVGDYFNNGNLDLLSDIIKQKYNINVKDVIKDKGIVTGLGDPVEDANDLGVTVRAQVVLPEDRI